MQDLEIFGSYEKSLAESKIITGHNNIKYVIGGNARYYTRGNITDWNSIDKSDVKLQIKTINDILKFPIYIDDEKLLLRALYEINNLHSGDFFKLLEKALNLKESILIQLRRLFYIVKKFITTDTEDKTIEFCPYEPIVRIESLLDSWPGMDLDCSELYYTLQTPIAKLDQLIEKKNKLLYLKMANSEKKSTITDEMDKFLSSYKNGYQILYNLEKINIEIALQLEKINDLLEAKLTS